MPWCALERFRFASPRRSSGLLACFFALLIFIASSLFNLASVARAESTAAELLGFTISFDGKHYDSTTDESTWYYTVSGPMVSGPTYKDLSHWILALCAPHEVVEASGHKWERRTNPDPHHGLIGIKWDDKVSKTDSRSFHFVLRGDWAVGETVAVAAKAGPETAAAVLPGPACSPDMCRVDYEVTSRVDWRVLTPGVFAARASQISLSGDNAVRLQFSDFQNPQYLADWTASTPIHLEYSVGKTLDDAVAFGWHSAAAFNDVEVIVPQHEVAVGTQLGVWVRGTFSAVNRSSDYRGGGRIAIVPLCD